MRTIELMQKMIYRGETNGCDVTRVDSDALEFIFGTGATIEQKTEKFKYGETYLFTGEKDTADEFGYPDAVVNTDHCGKWYLFICE